MSTLEQDLAQLNFEYLMLARECARNNPMEAAWRFCSATITLSGRRQLS